MTTITTSGVPVTYSDAGSGRPILLLHGGAGPGSVVGFAARSAASGLRVITPVHPGFDGSPRPEKLDSIAGLAALYVDLIADLDLTDVVVIGNSIGGWIAAEMNILGTARLSRVVIVDAVGLDLPDHPIVDFFALDMNEVIDRSFRDPTKFAIDLSSLSDAERAVSAANRTALATYGGTSMTDSTLRGRLRDSVAPTLVVWGTADRIVGAEHAAAYADGIPDARVALIESAGHLPQVETPDILQSLIDEFIAAH